MLLQSLEDGDEMDWGMERKEGGASSPVNSNAG